MVPSPSERLIFPSLFQLWQFNHLLCSNYFTSTVCTARVHGRQLGSCFLFVVNFYNDAYKTPFKRFFSLSVSFPLVASFHFCLAPPQCCNTHPQTACLLHKVVAIPRCVAVEYLLACLSDGKEDVPRDDICSARLYRLSLVMLKQKKTNNLHITSHIGQIAGHLNF